VASSKKRFIAFGKPPIYPVITELEFTYMSIRQTKAALLDALALSNTPVIAFHGPWGAGKTYLWREIAQDPGITKTHLYISCMAYGSVAELKSATISALLSRKSEAAKHGETAFNFLIGLVNTQLPEGFKFNTSLSDLQIFLPKLKSFVAGKTILVFDDIERATELNIHELLGFISFLVDQLEIQILLILNKEKLGGRLEAWEQLREKVISIEIALRVTPEDSITIGLGELPKTHLAIFSDRVNRLKITNIRALQHMHRVYKALSAKHNLDDAHWAHLIPSIVLYVAIHFGTIENAPAVEKALSKFSPFDHDDKTFTENEKKARDLLADYNLGIPDDFESKILKPYLDTGYLDTNALAAYVAESDLHRRRWEAESTFDNFISRYWWDTRVSTGDLIASIEQLRQRLDLLTANHATTLSKFARQLESPSLADAIIVDWIDANKLWLSTRIFDEHFLDFPDTLTIDDLHPTIKNAFVERYYQLYPPLSLREAVEHIARTSNWGSRHSRPIETASQKDFENLLYAADPSVCSNIFRFFSKYLRHPSSFPTATLRFTDACRTIVHSAPESRLASIINRSFSNAGMSEALKPPEANSATAKDHEEHHDVRNKNRAN
jgi:hypothetical protein